MLQENSDRKPSFNAVLLKQTAVKYGIIAGMATVLYLLFFYWLNPAYVTNRWVSFSTLLFVMLGMVAACVKRRKLNNGKLDRQEALKISFLVAVVAGIFFYGFIYLLFNFIDPGLNELLSKEVAMENPGQQNVPFQMTFGKVFFGYAFNLAYGFFLSLMVANFVKK
jgi:hypothetical protein